MSDIFTLDVETRPTHQSVKEFGALEAWRARHGTAEISSVAVAGPDGYIKQIENTGPEFVDHLKSLLKFLEGKKVYAHYATFDVAWLIATIEPSRTAKIPNLIKNIKWRDTRLLAKWCINGQKAEVKRISYGLSNLVQRFIKDNEEGALTVQEFINLKEEKVEAGQNNEYWIKRGRSDVIYTRALAEFFERNLPKEQRVGFIVESSNIIHVANSWIIGIRIDKEKLDKLKPRIAKAMNVLASSLGIAGSVMTSSKQLGNYLFEELQLPCNERTPKGLPKTGKDVLKVLAFDLRNKGMGEKADKLDRVMKYKELATITSKYIKTTYEALDHTTDGFIYGSPLMFGTYTGRFTYSNTTLNKFKTGIALHQMPRKANYIRELMLPPEGFAVLEADAAGQESRLMALRSGDPQMLDIFKHDMNFHSMSGASIIGMDYDKFMDLYKAGNEEYIEHRQRGKLLNLSANFRIGAKAFAKQAFVKYDVFIPVETAVYMLKIFNQQYQGVSQYWDKVIKDSKYSGFTQEFGGRRYKLSDWAGHRWVTESAALMFPIQGAGASMKNIAIKELHSQLDDVMFLLDLHDANFSITPKDLVKERYEQTIEVLNSINYEKYWGFKPVIPLPFEGGYGSSFGDVK